MPDFTSAAKNKRFKDRKFLNTFKEKPCLICGKMPSDPCHVKTIGSGGGDYDWNVLPMCRLHHIEQGQLGFKEMSLRHPKLMTSLHERGWSFLPSGKLKRV